MTEQEWLTASDYLAMLIYLRGDVPLADAARSGLYCGASYLATGEGQRVSRRKLRLVAAAFCDRWRALPLDGVSRHFLATYERFLADAATWGDVFKAGQPLYDTAVEGQEVRIGPMATQWTDTPFGVGRLGQSLAWATANHVARDSVAVTCRRATEEDRFAWGFSGIPDPLWLVTRKEVEDGYPQVLREIVGNPFRPYPAPSSWPPAVVALAEAAYQGDNCLAPLHDALLEAGHPELAEHFAKEQGHPKGCWVIDLLLGKK